MKINKTKKDRFVSLMDIIIADEEARGCFFVNPKQYIKQAGINLSKKDLEIIEKISLNNRIQKSAFNEKLVLCSSAGY